MYKFYNNNSLGLFENDCTVRAIALATGNSWDDTYKHLSNIARLQGIMMDDKDFIKKYLDERYERIYDIPRTVGEVAGAYPDNVLLITMPHHITCSKYGVIYDSFDCRDKTAEFVGRLNKICYNGYGEYYTFTLFFIYVIIKVVVR